MFLKPGGVRQYTECLYHRLFLLIIMNVCNGDGQSSHAFYSLCPFATERNGKHATLAT